MSNVKKNDVERAREIHEKAIFINALDATHLENWDNEFYDKLLKSGITLNQITVGGNFQQTTNSIMNFKEALKHVGMDKIIIARRTDDVKKAKKEGKIAVFFGIQSGRAIEREEMLLEPLYMMDVRVFGLCYNIRNHLADGCNEITDAGLSALGQKAVEKCNELGIVVDLSHVGRQSSLDAIEISKKPVVFTHSNAMKIYKNRRNLYDDQIKAIGEKNGVIGVTAFGPVVKQLKSNEDKAILKDFLDHLDYFVDMIGADHVGIGIDSDRKRSKVDVAKMQRQFDFNAAEHIIRSGRYEYDWNNWYVEELRDPTGWPKITEGLVERGYTDNEILKILGGNFMRVFKEVWDK